MLAPGMTNRRPKAADLPAAPPGPKKQFNVRLPPPLIVKLEAWRAELNSGRRLELTQADMVRGILDWAADNRPDWEKA
jgi:hypothetical protein